MTDLEHKQIKWAAWLLLGGLMFRGHTFLALYFLPTAVAITRRHRHMLIVFGLNLALGWTPAWLLVLMYSLERRDRVYKAASRHMRRFTNKRSNTKPKDDEDHADDDKNVIII